MLTAGENNITIDAGFVPIKASLGDFVWYDTNMNGQQKPGEPGVVGVTVKLFDPTSSTVTPIASLTTDNNGKYLFTNLNAGTYCVIFDKTTLPVGFTVTTANSGTDATDSDADPQTGKTGNYTLAAGEQNLTVDAGIVPVNMPTGSIGDFVWKDTNNNGIQDAGEPGVPNVGMKLLTNGQYVVRGTFSGAQENPPVTTPASGKVYATIDPATNVLSIEASFMGLTGTVTMAHLHTAITGTNGPVIIDLVPAGFPTGVTVGSFTGSVTLTTGAERPTFG